jgi:predicted CoA-binding protein
MKFLIDYEYQIYPVNPNETNILGRKCYPDLESIEEKIDMVDVFRAEKFILDISKVAIKIGAKILWTQEGIIDEKAASLGRSSGLKVVMDKCPKKVLKA